MNLYVERVNPDIYHILYKAKLLGYDVHDIGEAYIIHTPEDTLKFLSNIVDRKKSEDERNSKDELYLRRVEIADIEFENYDFDSHYGITIECHEKWIHEDEGSLYKKIYYKPIDADDLEDSLVGSFTVHFNKDSSFVTDCYANLD